MMVNVSFFDDIKQFSKRFEMIDKRNKEINDAKKQKD